MIRPKFVCRPRSELRAALVRACTHGPAMYLPALSWTSARENLCFWRRKKVVSNAQLIGRAASLSIFDHFSTGLSWTIFSILFRYISYCLTIYLLSFTNTFTSDLRPHSPQDMAGSWGNCWRPRPRLTVCTRTSASRLSPWHARRATRTWSRACSEPAHQVGRDGGYLFACVFLVLVTFM